MDARNPSASCKKRQYKGRLRRSRDPCNKVLGTLNEEALFEEACDARHEGHPVDGLNAADKLVTLCDLLPLSADHTDRRRLAGGGLRCRLRRQQSESEGHWEAGNGYRLNSSEPP